ncbi:MAG: 23S rRNA (adenine(2503)-C(2))-methyltransferase RlmN [Clostridiales bacterium]|jgi:23S rRNA (adenine2503-C2)-methyltransferase|nr:23S rRNA (adenine(2503)-C(2))-methyltransferase RlmN [Clostridiales bacterium]
MDIASMTPDEIADIIGDKPYRGKQIFRWIHSRLAGSFDEMTDLPKPVREKLKMSHTIGSRIKKLRSVQSADQTTKYLFQLENNTIIESVYMSYRFGGSVCASTQAGCRMGCVFCASGKTGLERNLAPSEICGQVYAIQREKPRAGHVVLMGCGEPLDNYDGTVRFIKLVSDENGQRLSRRSITVSTCGLTPRIVNLADEMMPVTLAVSLHAPDDAVREFLMPVVRAFPMNGLLRACAYYSDKTGRQVTYEYTMIKGVNDSLSQARDLAALLRGTLSHVNLIRLNETDDLDLKTSSDETIRRFADTLNERGVKTTVRRVLGSGISAACGQLRNHHNKFNSG